MDKDSSKLLIEKREQQTERIRKEKREELFNKRRNMEKLDGNIKVDINILDNNKNNSEHSFNYGHLEHSNYK